MLEDLTPVSESCFPDFAKMIPKSVFDCGLSETEAEELENGLNSQEGMDAMPETMFDNLIEYLLGNGKIRDALLLTLHANFGMRYSDVSQLRFISLLNLDGSFRTKLSFCEKKTAKIRNFYINEAVKAAVSVYLQLHPEKKITDYVIMSEGSRKGYEIQTYTDENGKTKALKENGNYVYKLDLNGEKIPTPLSRIQEERIIKNALSKMGVALKNNPNCKGGELKLNTHSLRKLYAEKFGQTGEYLKKIGVISSDVQIIQYIQFDLAHTNIQTTLRYSKRFEHDKEIICNNMNLGLYVWLKFIDEMQKENAKRGVISYG